MCMCVSAVHYNHPVSSLVKDELTVEPTPQQSSWAVAGIVCGVVAILFVGKL